MDKLKTTRLHFDFDMVCNVCPDMQVVRLPKPRPAQAGRLAAVTVASHGGSVVLDRRAVTALEYGVAAAFLCLTLLGIFSKFGAVLTTIFASASSGI